MPKNNVITCIYKNIVTLPIGPIYRYSYFSLRLTKISIGNLSRRKNLYRIDLYLTSLSEYYKLTAEREIVII